MQAIKENKVYTITEIQKERYLNQGYDIIGDDGEILEYSPLKKVTYSEYKKLLEENEKLLEENEKLKAQSEKPKGNKKEGA